MNLPESVCAGVAQISSMSPWALLLSKTTLLLTIAWLIHCTLARANPRWRVLLWRGVVVGLALLVVWSLGLPGLEVRVPAPEASAMLPSASLPSAAAEPEPLILSQADVLPMEVPPSAEMTTAAPQGSVDAGHDRALSVDTSRPRLSWQAALLSIWCFGVVLLLVRLAIRYLRLVRLLPTLQAAPEWVLAEVRRIAGAVACPRAVRVRSSRRFAVPFLYGLRSPVLVLPDRMCRPEYRSQLPGIVAHELAHVPSWDFAWNAGLQVVSILLWFHPLAWRIGSVHRAACDAVCDAVSASYLDDVQGYCRTLARVALEGAASVPAAGLAMARTCDVRRRITLLQRKVFAAALARRSAAVFVLAGLLSFALLAGLRLALAESAPQATPDQSTASSTLKGQESPPTVSKGSVKPGFRPMRIRVLDPAGKPITDAGVTVRAMTHLPHGPVRYRTDAEGIAAIEVPEHRSLDLQLLIWAERRVTVGASWPKGAVEKPVPAEFTLTMETGTTFGGIVQDEQGQPIAGAEVTVNGRKMRRDEVLWGSINDTSQTDAEGKWECHRVPADLTGFALNLKVRHPDYANTPAVYLNTESVEEFRNQTAVTLMRAGIVVEGTVTDPNGKPVAGALVGQFVNRTDHDAPLRPPGLGPGEWVLAGAAEGHAPNSRPAAPIRAYQPIRADQRTFNRATTDQDGRYRLPGCEPGEYVLAVAAEGHVPNSQRVTISVDQRTFGFQLLEGKPIRLRVVDEDGKPLADAKVSTVLDKEVLFVDNARSASRGGDRNFTTDAEGRWSRLWIPQDKLTFYISKPGYAQGRKNIGPDDEEHVVTLEAGGWSVAGRVVDRETKAPVTKFRLVEGIAQRSWGNDVIWCESRPVEDGSGQYHANWDTSGNSRRVVRIEAEGYLPSEIRRLKVFEKQAAFNVELGKGEAVTGVVLSPDGKPLADADVALCTAGRRLYLRNGRPASHQLALIVRTGADGRFSFTPQREPYDLVAMHEQGFAQVEDEQGMKDITVQPWARVEGTLEIGKKPGAKESISLDFRLGPPGEPDPWRIHIDYRTETDDEGHFVFDRVRPGKAKIQRNVKLSQEGMMSSWTATSVKSVELASGQTLRVNLSGIEQSAVRERHLAAEKLRKAASSRNLDSIERDNLIRAKLNVLLATPPAAQDDRIEAALELLRDYSISRHCGAWAEAVRVLIEIGEPAIPRLVAELDRTERNETSRALGFVLRGIGDPRAVPALIRAIPRTFRGGGSDFGLSLGDTPDVLEFLQQHDPSLIRAWPRTLRDGESDSRSQLDGLLKFMQQHDNTPRDESGTFTFGRPIREIMPALEKITGQSHGWLELNFADYQGQGAVQRRIKRTLFRDHAERWADWWSNNWREYVSSEADAQLPLIRKALDRYSESISKMPRRKPLSEIPCGSNAIVGGSVSNSRVRSFDESPSGGFLDLDSGRRPDPPQELIENSPGGGLSKDLLLWAGQEGVDLITLKTRLPGSDKSFYAFKPLGMKVWRIDNGRYDNLQNELRFSDELVLPTPWKGLIAQIDEESGKGDDELTVAFLFITQEGICGALQIRALMGRDPAPGSRAPGEGGYSYKFIYENDTEL